MSNELQIRLSGSGGQGLQLSARVLAAAFADEGRIVALSQSYEPTSRGGVSRSDLVVGDGLVDYPLVTALDYLVVLDEIAAAASTRLVKADAVVLCDSARVPEPPDGAFRVHALPFTERARRAGSERAANIVALGALAAIGALVGRNALEQALRAEVPSKLLDLNLEALADGERLAGSLVAA